MVQPGNKVVQYFLLMKHPAEDNVLKLRAIEKIVKQMSDIALHHLFCFVGDHEWTHIPTPVTVKKYVPREYLLQFAARCGFANARRTAYDDEVFHKPNISHRR